MKSVNRLVDLDQESYDPNDVPESGLEEALKVLRAFRAASIETNNHELDIIAARAIRELEQVARMHNKEIESNANARKSPTPDQNPDEERPDATPGPAS